jgi:hypothetical protein
MPAGRPKTVINYDLVRDLAGIACTQAEIAGIIGCVPETLQRDPEFCRIYKEQIENARSSLRRIQWKAAKEGSVPMMIFLGKQYLGQRDKPEGESITDVAEKMIEIVRASK